MLKEVVITIVTIVLLSCTSRRLEEGGSTAMNIGMILRKYIHIDELSPVDTKEDLKQRLLVSQLLTKEKREFYLGEIEKVDSLFLETEHLRVFIGQACFFVDKESAFSCAHIRQMQKKN